MSNSPLVDYTRISPNRNSPRNHAIDRITIHCVVGQCSVETLGEIFAPTSRQASSNYGIGYDGRVGMYCPEGDRSWCSSSGANDHRSVTIECASDTYHPYAVNDTAYNKLIDLCVDICRRNGKAKLLWLEDKNTALNYEPKADEMVMTAHRWFANTACPGDFLYSRFGDIANKVTAVLNGGVVPPTPVPTDKTVTYQSYSIPRGKWFPAVTSGEYVADTAGLPGENMGALAVKVSGENISYQVHEKGGIWLPAVSNFNIKDFYHGFAGNYRPIDGVCIYSSSIAYRVKQRANQVWLPWVYGKDANINDAIYGMAGNYGMDIDEIEIKIV